MIVCFSSCEYLLIADNIVPISSVHRAIMQVPASISTDESEITTLTAELAEGGGGIMTSSDVSSSSGSNLSADECADMIEEEEVNEEGDQEHGDRDDDDQSFVEESHSEFLVELVNSEDQVVTFEDDAVVDVAEEPAAVVEEPAALAETTSLSIDVVHEDDEDSSVAAVANPKELHVPKSSSSSVASSVASSNNNNITTTTDAAAPAAPTPQKNKKSLKKRLSFKVGGSFRRTFSSNSLASTGTNGSATSKNRKGAAAAIKGFVKAKSARVVA
eukprot:735262_1